MTRHLAPLLLVASALVTLGGVAAVHGQDARDDLRALHQLAVFSTVRIETPIGTGTGWLLTQNVPRPMVVTNRHVVEGSGGRIRVLHYGGSEGRLAETPAVVQWSSTSIDLALIRLEGDPSATARSLALEPGDVVRGERIVLGGNPAGLPFQTTEGVVTGALPEAAYTARCGQSRNCVVVDAASFSGSSGGPAINAAGRVVGMLWGGPPADVQSRVGSLPVWVQNPSFAFLIHVRTIENELRQYGEQQRARRGRTTTPD